jgi:enoyl-CoA hydratase
MTNDEGNSTICLERSGAVATLSVRPEGGGTGGSVHSDLADVLEELRRDNGIRVVVVTGADDTFFVPPPADLYRDRGSSSLERLTDPERVWLTFSGILRCHQAIAEMEKPVVAKVNGDAIGFGASLAFACDLIVASHNARFMDHHMSGGFTAMYQGVERRGGHEEFSVVPGDGGALMPLYLSPCRMKEYLMLCRTYDAVELERLGAINYAVPEDTLDAKVGELVDALLARGAYALAWTKRAANRCVVEQLNRALDTSVAYEMTSLYQLYRAKGDQPTTLSSRGRG